jgi:hypothetical protein
MRKVLVMLLLAAALGGCRQGGLRASGSAGAQSVRNSPATSAPARPRLPWSWSLAAFAVGAGLGAFGRWRGGRR